MSGKSGEHELTDDDRRILKYVADNARQQMPSRRDALKLGMTGFAAAGLGSAATATVAADASTSDDDGDVGQPDDRIDVFADGVDTNSVNTEALNSTINDGQYQSSIDGLVVPVAPSLGVGDAINPSTTSTPVQDGVDLVDGAATGTAWYGGAVLLPPSEISEDDTVSLVDKPSISIYGWGENRTKITFPDDVHGFELGGTWNADFEGFQVASSLSGSPTSVFLFGANGTEQSGGVKRICIDKIRVRNWYGDFITCDPGGGSPYENTIGQTRIELSDIDAGDTGSIVTDQAALINWGDGGRANCFGSINAYPTDSVSGSDSVVYNDTSGNDNSAYFRWLNLGGSVGTIADVSGGFVLTAANYEPNTQNSTDHPIFLFNGSSQRPQRVLSIEITGGPTVDSVYEWENAGNAWMVKPWERSGSATFGTNIINMTSAFSAGAYGYYFGPTGDITDNTSSGSGGIIPFDTAGTPVGY